MNKKVIKIVIGIFLIITINFILPTNSMAFGSIYKEPDIIQKQQGEGLDDMINDAQDFEKEKGAIVGKKGSQPFKINEGNLQNFSSNLFTSLITVATGISILVGIIIGVKYMMGSVEEKAKYKELLIPYLAGCAAVYGALGIWKLLVELLGSV